MQDWQQLGFWEKDQQEKAKGKNLDALAYSRFRRLEILRLFQGDLPMSLMSAKRITREDDPAFGSYSALANPGDNEKLASIFDVSNQNVRMGALSQFPQNIGRTVLLLYSQENDLVIDPFAGHNSRMALTVAEARRYQGYDISDEFMDFNRQERQRLIDITPGIEIELHTQDSRDLRFSDDESGDFTLTSPPYYNLERYGDQAEQLGKAGSYSTFLQELGKVCTENFRVLKPGSFCVWFVNDFRKNGVFYPFHIDTYNLLIMAGFTFWDMMIVDLGNPIRAAFATQIVDEQILPKRHEYGLIFRK